MAGDSVHCVAGPGLRGDVIADYRENERSLIRIEDDSGEGSHARQGSRLGSDDSTTRRGRLRSETVGERPGDAGDRQPLSKLSPPALCRYVGEHVGDRHGRNTVAWGQAAGIEEGEVLGVDPGTGKNLTGGARSAGEGTIVEKLLADEMPECLRDVVVGFSEHALHHFRDRGGFDPGKFLG